MKTILLILLPALFLCSCKKKQGCYTCKYVGSYDDMVHSTVQVNRNFRPDSTICDGHTVSHYYRITGGVYDTAVTVTCNN